MSFNDWQYYKVRPVNFPVRRIAAMSVLLVRYRNSGMLNSLKTILEKIAEDGIHSLEESLLVNAYGYWERYVDFSFPSKSKITTLLGQERAVEIIINVLLPFYAACAGAAYAYKSVLEEKTLHIFRNYQSPAENSLEKHMRQQLDIPPEMAATARRRQGLIHIYKTLCTQGKCGECPFGERRGDKITKIQDTNNKSQ
jgi:hypothetical protein